MDSRFHGNDPASLTLPTSLPSSLTLRRTGALRWTRRRAGPPTPFGLWRAGTLTNSKMAGFLSAHYRSKLEVSLRRGFSFNVTLLSGHEGQRLGKLKRNPSQKLTYVINARNET